MKHTAFAHAALSRRNLIRGGVLAAAALAFAGTQPAFAQTTSTAGATMQLTQEWDKTFPKSNKVDHQKVTFTNRYGITLVGDLYVPNITVAYLAEL